MTTASRPNSEWTDPGVLVYTLLCAVALAVLWLALGQSGIGVLSFVPLLVGVSGVLLRFRWTPALVLLCIAAALFYEQIQMGPFLWRWQTQASDLRLLDLLLCGSLLLFVSAHYRLQGLLLNIMPVDPRRREILPHSRQRRPGREPRMKAPVLHARRSSSLVSPGELTLLLLTLPLWVLLGQVLWKAFAMERDVLNLPPWLVRLIVMIWVLGIVLYLGATFLRHLERRRMSTAEGRLLLQEDLWRCTRSGQRRAGRWLAWLRLLPERKEKT
jgi:hypothetical protein